MSHSGGKYTLGPEIKRKKEKKKIGSSSPGLATKINKTRSLSFNKIVVLKFCFLSKKFSPDDDANIYSGRCLWRIMGLGSKRRLEDTCEKRRGRSGYIVERTFGSSTALGMPWPSQWGAPEKRLLFGRIARLVSRIMLSLWLGEPREAMALVWMLWHIPKVCWSSLLTTFSMTGYLLKGNLRGIPP